MAFLLEGQKMLLGIGCINCFWKLVHCDQAFAMHNPIFYYLVGS